MKTLSYKGYIDSIEVSEPDNCLYGKVLDLPKGTLISYEGETIKAVENQISSILQY